MELIKDELRLFLEFQRPGVTITFRSESMSFAARGLKHFDGAQSAKTGFVCSMRTVRTRELVEKLIIRNDRTRALVNI